MNTAFEFHQKGLIQPNTYLVDLEMIRRNSQLLLDEAKKHHLEIFFMTKQFGRNPLIAKEIVSTGIEKAVAVSPWEALSLYKEGIKIGHVGHLVQIPKHLIPEIIALHPDFVTVFSYEHAKMISDVAERMNKKQKILLRVANRTDFLYNGQEGGFTKEQIDEDIEKLESLAGIEIAGLTSFPCMLIENGVPKVTPNTFSMLEVKKLLMARGYTHLEMNMPSANSTFTIKMIKEHGATQIEPGHAFTGTTPMHAQGTLPNNAEKPAIVYVTEVSHIYENKTYVYGGGFYPRGNIKRALMGTNFENCQEVQVIPNDPASIDYYGVLNTPEGQVGDTVVMAFRTQVFVTNAQIAVVDNISTGTPEILGIYDKNGNQIK